MFQHDGPEVWDSDAKNEHFYEGWVLWLTTLRDYWRGDFRTYGGGVGEGLRRLARRARTNGNQDHKKPEGPTVTAAEHQEGSIPAAIEALLFVDHDAIERQEVLGVVRELFINLFDDKHTQTVEQFVEGLQQAHDQLLKIDDKNLTIPLTLVCNAISRAWDQLKQNQYTLLIQTGGDKFWRQIMVTMGCGKQADWTTAQLRAVSGPGVTWSADQLFKGERGQELYFKLRLLGLIKAQIRDGVKEK